MICMVFIKVFRWYEGLRVFCFYGVAFQSSFINLDLIFGLVNGFFVIFFVDFFFFFMFYYENNVIDEEYRNFNIENSNKYIYFNF